MDDSWQPMVAGGSRRPHAWLLSLVLVALLGIGVLAFLPQLVTAEAAARVLSHLRPWPIAGAVLALAVSYLAGGYTVHALVRLTEDRLPVLVGTRLVLAASGVGLLTGGVGFLAAKYHWARARGLSRDGALLCAWAPAILNSGVLFVLTAAGFVSLTSLLPANWRAGVAVTVFIAGVGIALAVHAVRARSRSVSARPGEGAALRNHEERQEPAPASLMDERQASPAGPMAMALAHVRTLRRRLGPGADRRRLASALVGAVAGAAGAVGMDLVVLGALFLAAGQHVALATVVLGFALPQAAGALSLLPGGLGVVEGGMVGLFVARGVPSATAVLVVLGYRGLAFWLPALLGLPIALLLQRDVRTGRWRAADDLPDAAAIDQLSAAAQLP